MADTIVNPAADLQKQLLPGTILDTCYTAGSNLSKVKSDVIGNNRFRQGFQSLQLGSAGLQFLIPNRSLLSEMMIHMEIPSIPENCYLPRGWGLILLSRCDMAIGGSQTLTVTRTDLFQALFRQCETEEKRNSIMHMMGDEVTGPLSVTDGPVHAVVPLGILFSSLRYLGRKVPYDSSLVNAPIRIALYLASSEELYMGLNAALAPRSLSRGYLQIRQLDFKENSDSLRQLLIEDPVLTYSYPFFYSQNFTSPPFQGSTDASALVNVNLTGFRRGNLQSIVFMIQPTSYNRRTDAAAMKNIFAFVRPTNITLIFNGQIVYEEAEDNDAWTIGHSLAAAEVPSLLVDPANVPTAPYVVTPIQSNFTEILLAQFNEVSFSNLIQSGASYENQVLTLTFTTPEGSDVEYRLYASYNYQATVLTSGQNAEFNF